MLSLLATPTSRAKILRDLLHVVNLRNINHENICCLNTAVLVAIFAHRNHLLRDVLYQLRLYGDDERFDCDVDRDGSPNFSTWTNNDHGNSRFNDSSYNHHLSSLAADSTRHYHQHGGTNPRRNNVIEDRQQDKEKPKNYDLITAASSSSTISNTPITILNFRELLWFWKEYYTHRGKDRLSIEFSSHLRFEEWQSVVKLLCADDGSSTALLSFRPSLPRSPYE